VALREEVTVHRNVKRFRGGLVFKAHRLMYHSTLGSRVIKKKKMLSKKHVVCTGGGARLSSGKVVISQLWGGEQAAGSSCLE